jgi:DNA-binding FadR family transcriptional regulator
MSSEPEAGLFVGGRSNAQWVAPARNLAREIRTGRIAPGERLPPVPDMAMAASVSRGVMSRALRRLRQLGYVVLRAGEGYYVSDTPPGLSAPPR